MSEIAQSLDKLTKFAQDWFIAENQLRRQDAKEDRALQMEWYKYYIENTKDRISTLDEQYATARENYLSTGAKLEALPIKTYESAELLDIVSQGPLDMLDKMYKENLEKERILKSNLEEIERADRIVSQYTDDYLQFTDPGATGDPTIIDPEDVDAALDKFITESETVLNTPLTAQDIDMLVGPTSQMKTPAQLALLQSANTARLQQDIESIKAGATMETLDASQNIATLQIGKKAIDNEMSFLLSPVESGLQTLFGNIMTEKNNQATLEMDSGELAQSNENIQTGYKTIGASLFTFLDNEELEVEQASQLYFSMIEAADKNNPNKQGIIDYLKTASSYYQTLEGASAEDFAYQVQQALRFDITDPNAIIELVEGQQRLRDISLEILNQAPNLILPDLGGNEVEEGLIDTTALPVTPVIGDILYNAPDINTLIDNDNEYIKQSIDSLTPTFQIDNPSTVTDSILVEQTGKTLAEIDDSLATITKTGLGTLFGMDESKEMYKRHKEGKDLLLEGHKQAKIEDAASTAENYLLEFSSTLSDVISTADSLFLGNKISYDAEGKPFEFFLESGPELRDKHIKDYLKKEYARVVQEDGYTGTYLKWLLQRIRGEGLYMPGALEGLEE